MEGWTVDDTFDRGAFRITPLRVGMIPQVEWLLGIGAPYVRIRSTSDYWLYATLFSATCPVALHRGVAVGVVIAFRSQDNPDDVYVQDVAVHPHHRRRGIATDLLGYVRHQARSWGCRRMYLTSEPDNTAAHATWLALGFVNLPGDRTEHGVSVIADFKGPGKDRAVYERNVDA